MSIAANAIRIGVDIGGTFTDVVLEVNNKQYSTKILTLYDAPEKAIVDGINQVCDKAGIMPAQVQQIIHGTTLATNALIERKGAKTAFITTQGFRDVIEMRTESRFEQYDLNLDLPDPLLARNRRYTVLERINARGETLIPLKRSDAEAVVAQIKNAGYESIAVGLLHSYANSAHEDMIKTVIEEKMPGAMVSLSSQVSPQMREYERFNTVVVNAYIKPLMKRYLDRLKQSLQHNNIGCPVFLMHSGGGIISIESAAEFPVRLVESGPAGGAVFAANIAAKYGLDKVLSFDMGGTTAKICLINNQAPKTSRVFEVARTYRFKKGSGMPISIPVIDMVEIGAGGGSIAHVDVLRQIRVGPESAGSEPGPACYGRGGDKPTVTDADLILGKLDPDNFAGGSIVLNSGKSKNALDSELGNKLDIDTQTAAYGLLEVVDENMANAARVHAIENGEDLSNYTMIAFGGAAPLHAGRLCEKLGVNRLLVPVGAGVGSAVGFLRAPFSFEANRSVFMKLSEFDSEKIKTIFVELNTETRQFVRTCDAKASIVSEYKVYMRYSGQGWEIPIDLSAQQAENPELNTYTQLFEKEYTTLFGRHVKGMDIEMMLWSVNASTPKPDAQLIKLTQNMGSAEISGQRQLFDTAQGEKVDASIVQRQVMQVGQTVQGPAIITEDETTIVVPSNRSAIKQTDGCIDITVPSLEVRSNFNHSVPDVSLAPNKGNKGNNVTYQVMWNRIISVVEEQAQALIRTAFSTSVREAGDLSAGVYDVTGRMLAQAVTGTPGHVNAMAAAVGHFIRRIGRNNIFEGDVYITNDPWEGTGHLHDITVVTPCFYQSQLIGFFACTAHVVDIGGRGFGADAASVYEEGIHIPIMKLFERGQVDKPFIHLLRTNVREPDQLIGDLYALATCNEIGQQRLIAMLQEFKLSNLEQIAKFILSHSKLATLEKIQQLFDAKSCTTASGEMTIDGYDFPIVLKASLEIQPNQILCDFTGTSGIDPKGINVPLVYTQAYACYALKCAIAPEVPNNAASLAPFVITAPENSIVNALHPAPVALRHVIGHMIPDTVYNALDAILPNTVPAEGAGTLCNFQLSIRPRTDRQAPENAQRSEILTFNSGGSGARPSKDGMNTTAFPSGVMTMPVEATEHAGPVIIWRKELKPDSAGAGSYRGGLGQYMEVGVMEGYEFDFQAMFDRVHFPAKGRNNGGNGAPTRITNSNGSAMRGKGKQFVASGERVLMEFPGGAGYGDPTKRDKALIMRDIAMGYISVEHAKKYYAITSAETGNMSSATIFNASSGPKQS